MHESAINEPRCTGVFGVKIGARGIAGVEQTGGGAATLDEEDVLE